MYMRLRDGLKTISEEGSGRAKLAEQLLRYRDEESGNQEK